MSSVDQVGWVTKSRGANSTMYGLTSSTGVPSSASRSATWRSRPSTASSRQLETPRRFGRKGPCPAKTPTRGPGRVAPGRARFGAHLRRVDPVEVEHHFEVGEAGQAEDHAGVELLGVQADHGLHAVPVVFDPLVSAAGHRADGPQGYLAGHVEVSHATIKESPVR
jgi:hypothetical protein